MNSREDFSVDTAIILAAGKGTRLGDAVPADLPKCLIDVAGKRILERQLIALARHGVRKAVVVVGYEKQKVMDFCKALGSELGLSFEFVENPDYATTNTVYSLYLARRFMRNGFLYLNADVVFAPQIVEHLQFSPYVNALAVEFKPCGEEEVKVGLLPSGRIVRIEKSIDPKQSQGEFIGVARFGAATAPLFAASLEYVCEQEKKVAMFFEYALDRIADTMPMFAVSTNGLPVIEIDFPEDLHKARTEIAPAIDSETV